MSTILSLPGTGHIRKHGLFGQVKHFALLLILVFPGIGMGQAPEQRSDSIAHHGHSGSSYTLSDLAGLRCMTPLLIEADRLGPKAQIPTEVAALVNAPPLVADADYLSASARFRLHYDLEGVHAVPSLDENQNGIPDYIEFAAAYADSSYNYLVEQLGFVDFLIPGRPYDIYFRNFSFYGLTRSTTVQVDGISYPTTYIEVHRNFNGFPQNQDPDGQQLGSLKVTIAHEMKHAIQFATNRWRGDAGTVNWVELDATMIEEVVFPTVKDYLNYLTASTSVFRGPHRGVPRAYEQATFGLYYVERFGHDFWVDVWREVQQTPLIPMFDAMNLALEARGADFSAEFVRNLAWHMASGDRHRPGYGFTDASLYPNVVISQSAAALPYISPEPSMVPFSGRFYEITPPFGLQGEVAAALLRNSSRQTMAMLGFMSDGSVRELVLWDGAVDEFASTLPADEAAGASRVASTTDFNGISGDGAPISETSEEAYFRGVHTSWSWADVERLGLVLANAGPESGLVAQFTAGESDELRGIHAYGDLNADGRTNRADAEEMLMRVVQAPAGAAASLPRVESALADVSGDGAVTSFDAALVWRASEFGISGGFPADPDAAGWYPAASLMQRTQTMASAQSKVPAASEPLTERVAAVEPAAYHDTTGEPLTGRVAAVEPLTETDLSARFQVGTTPDDDTLRVFLDLARRDSYTSVFLDVDFDSSLVSLQRVQLPGVDPFNQLNRYFYTDSGARIAAISSVGGVNRTVIELIFSPMQDTTAQISFSSVHFDERFSAEPGPSVSARIQPKEGVGVPVDGDLPSLTRLHPAYPNPFNPATVIPFSVGEPSRVEIKLYDMLGKQVADVFANEVSAGRHQVRFNAASLAGGVYVIRFTAMGYNSLSPVHSTQKITLIK